MELRHLGASPIALGLESLHLSVVPHYRGADLLTLGLESLDLGAELSAFIPDRTLAVSESRSEPIGLVHGVLSLEVRAVPVGTDVVELLVTLPEPLGQPLDLGAGRVAVGVPMLLSLAVGTIALGLLAAETLDLAPEAVDLGEERGPFDGRRRWLQRCNRGELGAARFAQGLDGRGRPDPLGIGLIVEQTAVRGRNASRSMGRIRRRLRLGSATEAPLAILADQVASDVGAPDHQSGQTARASGSDPLVLGRRRSPGSGISFPGGQGTRLDRLLGQEDLAASLAEHRLAEVLALDS
jgi:hypothetical protein